MLDTIRITLADADLYLVQPWVWPLLLGLVWVVITLKGALHLVSE